MRHGFIKLLTSFVEWLHFTFGQSKIEKYMKKIKRIKKKEESEQSEGHFHDKNNVALADKLYQSGYVLHKKGRLDEAILHYQKALQHNPSSALTLYALGTAYHGKNKIDEAVAYYQKALQLDPGLIGAYYNLGTVFQEKKQLDEAILCYQKVIDMNPGLTDPYYNIGLALQEEGQTEEASAAYEKALHVNPSFVAARWAKCMCQIPVIYTHQSGIEASRARYHAELLTLRDTVSLKASQEIDAAVEAVGKQQPFFLAYQGLNDGELQRLYGELVYRIMSSKYPSFAGPVPMPSHSQGEPLRIGIVSGFFYYHAIWKIPIKGWIENIDTHRFSLYGYHTGHKKDKATDGARKCFTRFIEDTNSFEELCKIIRADNLHILIYPEIGMDPATVKLAALRLAPVQCASWGHPDTSGLPGIDYYLSSALIEPPDGDEHYTEKLVRLPNLSIYYTPVEMKNRELSRETLGLRPKSVLYHCFQSLYKHLPQHDELFPKIAQRVGDCQFLFVEYPNIPQVVERFRLRINQAFERFNLNAGDYVVILPPLPPELYEALNRLADVYLDTIGWSGCNSVLEALSSHLPVVTLPTRLMRGREGFAILTMMGVTETIAATPDDYVDIAVRLGNDTELRRSISEKIAATRHLVYRDNACIKGLEDFFEKVVANRR
jgi:predicted O-linked N-acetylglucosamine transferase (SPINDLY family)